MWRSSRLDAADVRQPPRRCALELELDPPLLRGTSERVHVAGGDDAAVVDDRDVLADVLDEIELVAGEEDSRAASRLAPQNLGERVYGDRVEPGERLVEHEHIRFVQECNRELCALLVAMRELVEPGIGAVGEPEPLEPPSCRSPCRAVIQPVQTPEVGELFTDPHARIEAALLRHVTEPQPFGRLDRPSVPEHLPRIELDEPEDRPHRRRLSCPVGAEEAEHPPALDGERAVGECLHCPEPLVHVREAEHRPSQSALAPLSHDPPHR